MINYHELTIAEDKNSKQRKYQFIVICTIIGAAITYSSLKAGVLQPLDIQTGTFPGGPFLYKTAKRDYAASASLERHVAEQVGDGLRHDTVDQVYSVFLDDPGQIADGRRLRFASGYLVHNAKAMERGHEYGEEVQERLLAYNVHIQTPTRSEIRELPAEYLWARLKFKSTNLPPAKAGIVNFPTSNGFVSCLVFSMRILPALRKYAKKQGYIPTVILSTCSEKENMCTHYVPLIDTSERPTSPYLLGQPSFEDYFASLPPERPILSLEDVTHMWAYLMRYFGFAKPPPPGPEGEGTATTTTTTDEASYEL
jgi:hypothetical protein